MGFNVAIAQWGAGTITIAAGSGATNRSAVTASSAQYKTLSILVLKNANGGAASSSSERRDAPAPAFADRHWRAGGRASLSALMSQRFRSEGYTNLNSGTTYAQALGDGVRLRLCRFIMANDQAVTYEIQGFRLPHRPSATTIWSRSRRRMARSPSPA